MPEPLLPIKEINDLKSAHRRAKTRRDADRIKAVVLVGKGWTVAHVAEALLMDEDSIRSYWRRYRSGGLDALCKDEYSGRKGRLDETQIEELEAH